MEIIIYPIARQDVCFLGQELIVSLGKNISKRKTQNTIILLIY